MTWWLAEAPLWWLPLRLMVEKPRIGQDIGSWHGSGAKLCCDIQDCESSQMAQPVLFRKATTRACIHSLPELLSTPRHHKGVVLWKPKFCASFPLGSNLLLLPTQGNRNHISVVSSVKRLGPGQNCLDKSSRSMHPHTPCILEQSPVSSLPETSYLEVSIQQMGGRVACQALQTLWQGFLRIWVCPH